jgi:predicted membrane channel-forming protein YqfA (hemolysin III family)
MRKVNELVNLFLYLVEMSFLIMFAVVLLQQTEYQDPNTFAKNLNNNMEYVVIPIFGIAAVKLIQFFVGITGFEDLEYR